MDYKDRINSIRKSLSKSDIDTAFISSKDNISLINETRLAELAAVS